MRQLQWENKRKHPANKIKHFRTGSWGWKRAGTGSRETLMHRVQQDQAVTLITPMGQVVNSFSYQELKGLKHFHSDTQRKTGKHRMAVCYYN